MKKALLTIAITASLSHIAFAIEQNSTSEPLEKVASNIKTMKDLKGASLKCQAYDPNGEATQCIEQSQDIAMGYFKDIGLELNADNYSTITYVFDNTSKKATCSYGIANSDMSECNDDAPFRLLFIGAQDLSQKDVAIAKKQLAKEFEEKNTEKFSQDGRSFSMTDYDAPNDVSIMTSANFEKGSPNNINLVVNYSQHS